MDGGVIPDKYYPERGAIIPSSGEALGELLKIAGEVPADIVERELRQDRGRGFALQEEPEGLADHVLGLDLAEIQLVEQHLGDRHPVGGRGGALGDLYAEGALLERSDPDLAYLDLPLLSLATLVPALAADALVAAGSSAELVVASVASDPVVALSADQLVLAGAADDQVLSAAAPDHVVTAEPAEDLLAAASAEDVVLLGSHDLGKR
jgi:hypothetical protein